MNAGRLIKVSAELVICCSNWFSQHVGFITFCGRGRCFRSFSNVSMAIWNRRLAPTGLAAYCLQNLLGSGLKARHPKEYFNNISVDAHINQKILSKWRMKVIVYNYINYICIYYIIYSQIWGWPNTATHYPSLIKFKPGQAHPKSNMSNQQKTIEGIVDSWAYNSPSFSGCMGHSTQRPP